MQDHDERRAPLDPQPESRSLLESFRFWIATNVLRRNQLDERQAKAAAENAKLRDGGAK